MLAPSFTVNGQKKKWDCTSEWFNIRLESIVVHEGSFLD